MLQIQVAPFIRRTWVCNVEDVIFLSHRTRIFLWWLLVILQLLTATLLGILASVYFNYDTPGSLLWTATIFFIYRDGYVFINRFSTIVAVGYAFLGAAFSISGLRLAWLALRSRHASFGTPTFRGAPGSNPARLTEDNRHSGVYKRLRRSLSRTYVSVSVHGTSFEVRQLISGVISLASQTTAAYLSSRSISNMYLNQTYGFIIFLSGISILAFSKRYRHSQLTQRFAYLLTDFLLDVVWGCVLPLWMRLPVMKLVYNTTDPNTVDGESTAREIARVFILSWPSYLLSVFPYVKSLFSLSELLAMLRDDVRWVSNSAEKPPLQQSVGASRSRWTKCAHTFLAVYGCVLLGISISTSDFLSIVQRQPQFRCSFRLHPWFSTKEACIKRTIDCSTVGIQGDATELEAVLDLLDEDSLSDLTFVGCSKLTMPTALLRFSNLETVLVRDSRIASWPLEVAASDKNFPILKTIALIDVDTNTTLHGLVSTPLASTMEFVLFNGVPNAGLILASVGTNWQHLVYFDCDRCNITEVPSVVDSMHQLLTLSLIDNNISVLRDDFITRWDLLLVGLWMDSNEGLTELSDVVWHQAATCDIFSMRNTNLSVIPDWLPEVAHPGFVIYASGTPLCNPDKALLGMLNPGVKALVECEVMVTS